MSGSANPNWDAVEQLLQLFYPQYFDPNSPHYLDPAIMQALDMIAMEARPWCLPVHTQNLAEALYLAFLISLRAESSSGIKFQQVSGPVTSEKEGDIQVQYADLTANPNATMSKRPPSDPWDGWNRLWQRCAVGSIMTRYGDPARQLSSLELTNKLSNRAMVLFNG